MKSSKLVGGWRPLMGVAIVGALALGVSALAAPRGAEEAVRGTVKSGTEVTRLVTGDPAQINAVVAGTGATAILAMNPVNPPGGLPAYPAGVSIVGNELRIDRATNKDGFRAWFHVQVSDWDPAGDGPNLATYQFKIDCSGYYNSDCLDLVPNTGLDGLDLVPAVQACGSNADCRPPSATGMGEAWVKCVGGFCENGYIDFAGTGAPSPEDESWCEPNAANCQAGGVATGTCNYNYFSVADPDIGGRADGGLLYYGGTLVLDLPAGAKGKYTIGLNNDETFVAKPGTPPEVLDSLVESGFVVNFVTGSCCYLLGTPLAGCADQCLNRTDCAALGAPFVFTPGATCANKPTDDGCVECTGDNPLTDLTCDDGDSCTTESCNVAGGFCVRGLVGGWDTATECCDGSGDVAVIALIDDFNPCTDDTCDPGPVPPNAPPDSANGVPKHTPSSASTLCNDGNSCSTADHCAGPPSTSCTGTNINTIPCTSNAQCVLPEGSYECVDTDGNGSLDHCFCTLIPPITFEIPIGDPKTCAGGINEGDLCTSNEDCPGSYCILFAPDTNCFDPGDKVTAVVHIGQAGNLINGGQFLIKLNLGGCMEFNSVTCLAPYVDTVYGPIVNDAEGTIFVACSVDPFAGVNGPQGDVDILSLNFTKVGECNQCDLCFGTADDNPRNTYLVNELGQRVEVEGETCKSVRSRSELDLNVPLNITTNADCDGPTAIETWDRPTAVDSCGGASLICRGAHELGYSYPQGVVMNGGEMLSGASSFCCYAVSSDPCGVMAGCTGAVNDCADADHDEKADGCWTVQVNDEVSLDIDVQLEPPLAANELERCIKFCLYATAAEAPICWSEDVTFGGDWNFMGKSRDKIKANGTRQWGCITAQDQLHTLRSCYTFGAGDCKDGQLRAQFAGDPLFGGDGNWLIGGNLDAWKKDVPGTSPSLDVIDILDYGTFISQYGADYGSGDTLCPAVDHGPNADINGDGDVTMADYNFVLDNFMVSAKECCGRPSAASVPPALVEVSVEQLREMGLEDLVVADLNGDGVLNADDMDAFMQGARPTKASHDRKVGKGLRSGR